MKTLITLLFLLVSNSMFARILYVDSSATGLNNGTSWSHAYAKLQDALTNSTSGDSLWVKTGSYYPDEGQGFTNDNVNHFFSLKSNVHLFGGFVGNEIALNQRISTNRSTLSGLIGVNIHSRLVVKAVSVNNIIIDGFLITEGKATGENVDRTAAGLHAVNFDNFLIKNCIFLKNQYFMNQRNGSVASVAGGMYSDGNNLKVFDSIFRDNSFQVTMALDPEAYGGASVIDCAGGVICKGGTTIFRNVIFDYNRAITNTWDGLVCGAGFISSAYFGNCIFINNRAQILSVALASGTSTFVGGSLHFTNCAFISNQAVASGGAYANASLVDFQSGTATNNIIYQNSSTGGPGQGGGSFYNDLTISGNNMSQIDPLFINFLDPDGPDNIWFTSDDGLNLHHCSPAINRGTNAELGTLTSDILGNPRIHDNRVDLGPYERIILTPPYHQVYVSPTHDISSSVGPISALSSMSLGNKINQTGNVNYTAPRSISMLPGFEVKTGGVFKAETSTCQ